MTGPSQQESRKAMPAFPRTGAGRQVFNPRSPAEYGTDKAVLAAMYEDIGGPKRAAVVLGYGATKTYDLANPDHPEETVQYRHMRQLTVAGGTAAAEDLAHLAGGVFLPLPKAGEGVLAGLTAEMLRQSGMTAAELMQAMLDGKVTRDEALAGLQSLDELQVLLSTMRAHLQGIVTPPGAGGV